MSLAASSGSTTRNRFASLGQVLISAPTCSYNVHRGSHTYSPAWHDCVKVQCLNCRPCTGLLLCVREDSNRLADHT